MRSAAYNVENLLDRPKAMDPEEGDADERSKALAAQAEVAGLLDRPSYAGAEDRILTLLESLGVLRDDEGGRYVRLRKFEYHFEGPTGQRLVIMPNHLKIKGDSSPGDPIGAKKRAQQTKRVKGIYLALLDEGLDQIAIMGDLNDDPESDAREELLSLASLTNIREHENFAWNGRLGTYGSGNRADKIDYILMSDPLFARTTGGGVFRKGVWHGPRTRDPWDMFETLTSPQEEASDHAAIYADLV